MEQGERVVILGAGVGGLAAAWVLATRGYAVTILEKSDRIGGLAATLERDGFRYDLGPHNIHTRYGYIIDFLKRRFTSLFLHAPSFRIRRRGTSIEYPLRGMKVITNLPAIRLLPAILSFMLARIRMFATEPARDRSFADWICNRFGKVLYREYFHDYPAKVWQLSPDRIDRVVGEKRIPIFGLVELVRSVILGRTARVDHPEVTSENYYLGQGIGEIPDFLAAELLKLGVSIRTGTSPSALEVHEGLITAVTVIGESGAQEKIPCTHLLSTIPVNDLVTLLAPQSHPVRASASALSYCASVLVFLRVSRRGILPSTILYFSEPAILFSRVCDLGEFSPAMVPEGRTLLCLEFPCTVGDSTWTKSDDELTAHAVQALSEAGLLAPEDIEGSFAEHISHSYPRFQLGYADHVHACFAFLSSHRNLLSYGRQGGFAYINTDAVLHQGFQAASAVMMAEALGYGLQEWFTAQTAGR